MNLSAELNDQHSVGGSIGKALTSSGKFLGPSNTYDFPRPFLFLCNIPEKKKDLKERCRSDSCNLKAQYKLFSLSKTADTISGNSSVGTRAPDPLSRLASPLSFTSEGSLPSEQNDRDENEHNREKVAQQDQDEDEGKGKNKKKIKTILRKLQNSKKTKSSK